MTLNNTWIAARNLDCAIDNLKMQLSEWFWLIFWRIWWWNPVAFTWRMISYGTFYAIFGVPIIFWTFYKSVYEFGPEHIPKRSFCEILKQPVPSESDVDNNKVKLRPGAGCKTSRQVFRARPLSRIIARNKKLQDKQVYKERNWQSWAGHVNNGPTNHMPPLASKYCTYSYYQCPQASILGAGQCGVNHEMTLPFFWITNKFHPPEIHFLPKPWRPPDGVITNAIFGTLVAISFGAILGKVLAKFYIKRI